MWMNSGKRESEEFFHHPLEPKRNTIQLIEVETGQTGETLEDVPILDSDLLMNSSEEIRGQHDTRLDQLANINYNGC